MGLVQEFSKCGLAPLVVALILLGLARAYPGRFLYFTSQASTRLITTEPGGNDICLLASSKPTEYELSTGKNHFHEISPDSSQDLPVVADQRDTHVGTGRHKLTDFAFRQEKPTPVSLVAAASETYRLEFRSPDKELVSGCCQVRLEDTTPATAQDKTRAAAEKAFVEAEQLRAEWRAESSRKAIRKYQAALVHWKAVGERKEEANTLRNIGEIYHQLGNPRRGMEYYNQALRISQEVRDHCGEGETLNDIGSIYLQFGENQKALEYCTKALRLSRDAGNRVGEAQALNSLGDVYAFFGKMQESLEFYRDALQLTRELDDARGQAQALLNLGYTHSDLSDNSKALEYYNEALALWRTLNHRRGVALTLTALGHLYSKVGENQEALSLYYQARQLFEPMGHPLGESWVLSGMGYVYLELGEKQKALDYYNQGLRLDQALSYRHSEALFLIQIGRVYSSLGNNEKALDYYHRALSLYRAQADGRMESVALGDIGNIHYHLGDKRKALEYYNQALLLNRASGYEREEAYTLNSIGHLYQGSGQRQKAFDYFTQALSLNRAAEDRFGEFSTLCNIARVERDRGNLTEARSRLEAALKVAESLRTKVASHELRASYFASARQGYDLHIDLLMQMHKQQPSEGFDTAALQASERARARSLLESLAEAGADIRQGVDPTLLERERSLQQLLTAKAERRMRLLSGKSNKEEADAVAREIRDFTAEYEDVQGQIRSKSPRYAALTQPQPLSLSEIQQQVLDDDTLLLEYALGDERSYLWSVTRREIASYELPKRSEIEKGARHVYELLIVRQPKTGEAPMQHQTRVTEANAQYWREAGALSRMLLGPAAATLGSKRLLIVTEGALQFLPFGALPVPQENSTDREAPVPLVVEHEIVNLPSASALAVLRREILQRKAPPKAVAVLADPVFEADDPRVRGVQDGQKNPAIRSASARRLTSPASDLHRALRDVGVVRDGVGIPRLLSTRQEAEAIMAVTPQGAALRAVDFQASRETATSPDLGQYRIVHFATHGLLNSEHPELSGIVLSLVDQQGRPQNGFLRLRDIYNLNLPVDLVVLSACNTALGKDVKGEGLVGIVRGFMYAGAPRVVASLWKVDDEGTAELMKQFYQRIFQGGLPPAAALREAQIAMWREKRWHSPYYWAAFVLQGEWK